MLALSLFVGALALRSDGVQDQLRQWVEKRATEVSGREVTLNDLEVELLPPTLELEGLRVGGEEKSTPPFLELDRARMEPTFLGLWRQLITGRGLHWRQIDLRSPRLYLQIDEQGVLSLPRLPPSSGGELRIDAVVVEGGELRLDDLQISLSFSAEELRTRLVGEDPGELQGQLAADQVMLQLPEAEPYPVDLRINGWLSPGRVDIVEGSLRGQDFVSELEGRWVWAAKSLGEDTLERALDPSAEDAAGTAEAGLPSLDPLSPSFEADPSPSREPVATMGAPEDSAVGGANAGDAAGGAEEGRGSSPSVLYLAVSSQGDARFFDRLGYSDGVVEGLLSTEGVVTWRAGESLVYRGEVASPELRFLGRSWQAVGGRLEARGDAVLLDLESASYAGGSLAGTLRVDPKAPGLPLEADLRFEGLSADELLELEGLPLRGVASTIDGTLLYRCSKQGRDRGDGWGSFSLSPREGAVGLPTVGEIPFLIDDGVLTSSAVFLASEGQQTEGTLSLELPTGVGSLTLEQSSEDLASLAQLFLPYLGSDPQAAWVPQQGQGDLEIALRWPGKEQPPQVEARLDLEEIVTSELEADRVRGVLRTRPGWLDLSSIELSRGRGAMLISGSVPLSARETAPSVEPPLLDLSFEALEWPLQEIASFRELGLPGEGPISGRLTLNGPTGSVRGSVEGRVAPAELLGVPWRRADVRLGWDSRELEVEQLDVHAAAGTLAVSGTLGQDDDSLGLALSARDLDLSAAPFAEFLAERSDQVRGRVDIEGRLEGTRSAPRGGLEATLRELSLGATAGDPELRPPVFAEGTLAAQWDGRRLTVEGEVPELLSLRGEGELEIDIATAKRQASAPALGGLGAFTPAVSDTLDLRLEVSSERLRALTEVLADRALPGLEGEIAGQVRLSGQALEPASWRLRGTFPRLAGSYGERSFEAPEAFRAGVSAQATFIDTLRLVEAETGSEARLSGRIAETLDLRFDVDLDSLWLEPLWADLQLPSETDLRGRITARGSATGSASAPELSGEGELEIEPFVAPYASQAVSEASARFSFVPGRIELSSLAARVGEGAMEAQGWVDWAHPAQPDRQPGYRFNAQLKDLRLLYPEGWLQEGSADLVLVNDPERGGSELQGTVELSQLRYLATVENGVVGVLQSLLAPERVVLGPAQEWLSATHLDLDVRAPGTLRVSNPLANLRGNLELEVRGNLARPVLLGNVALLPGGTLNYAGNEYRVRRGLMTFTNPYATEPVLDLEATARVRSYEVLLQLDGTLDRLQVEVASDPPLPELDVMALVAGGRPLARQARPALPGSSDEGRLDAEAFLYGQAASALTDRFNNLFGFDKFRVDPLSEGGDSVSSVRVTVGKRLSKDLFVTYSRDPSTTEEDILEAEWQVSPLLMLVFTQNGDGSFSMDALWDRQF